MSKYTAEFKLKVVKYCLSHQIGHKKTAHKYGLAPGMVRRWIKSYEEHGYNGLQKNKNSTYSGKFKQHVVEYMLENHLSATETSTHFNLGGAPVVINWEKIYNEKGPQALCEERRGAKRKMKKESKKKNLNEKDLLAEVEQLRMENEYLKKLNALVQERIKRENKKK